ncbi:MAG: nucleotidyltransferase domain-containing protein [Caldicoprobacterales bacterium]|jgi:predicted nucleotidyltransferase|nr:nucleotidyltransferase domain-containing protein [Clostridiales bacterium]
MASFNDKSTVKKIAERYAELLKEEIDVQSVYLFGSYVKGTNTKDSDIDILVVSDSFGDDVIEDRVKLMKIRRKVDYRIEPHPLRSSEFDLSNPFVREVLNTSIRIM